MSRPPQLWLNVSLQPCVEECHATTWPGAGPAILLPGARPTGSGCRRSAGSSETGWRCPPHLAGAASRCSPAGRPTAAQSRPGPRRCRDRPQQQQRAGAHREAAGGDRALRCAQPEPARLGIDPADRRALVTPHAGLPGRPAAGPRRAAPGRRWRRPAVSRPASSESSAGRTAAASSAVRQRGRRARAGPSAAIRRSQRQLRVRRKSQSMPYFVLDLVQNSPGRAAGTRNRSSVRDPGRMLAEQKPPSEPAFGPPQRIPARIGLLGLQRGPQPPVYPPPITARSAQSASAGGRRVALIEPWHRLCRRQGALYACVIHQQQGHGAADTKCRRSGAPICHCAWLASLPAG